MATKATAATWIAAAALAAGCGSSRPGFDRDAPDAATPGFGEGGAPCAFDPGNFEVPDNGCDDDGDGVIDNAPSCDAALPVFGGADDFARAIGLCQRAEGPDDPRWGVISASFTRGHASAQAPPEGQHGILPSFGDVITAREGENLGVLSTGWARAYYDVEATHCDPATLTHCFKQGVQMQSGAPEVGAAPSGYPRAVAGCAVSDQLFDPISVKLTIKVPKNAHGFAVDFDFFSGEWPDYVCTRYNDAFLVYLGSSAFNGGVPDNVAFDAANAPVSVNNAFFDRCTVGTQTGCRGEPPILGLSTCGGDLSELEGTGFFAPGLYCNGQLSTGGGATGWLTTQAPVAPGEVMTLEFLIWDTGDPKFDSTVLLDGFRWTLDDTAPSTSRLR
jgi:hypothetical protein